MLPSSALLLSSCFLHGCNKDVLFNLRVSSLTEPEFEEEKRKMRKKDNTSLLHPERKPGLCKQSIPLFPSPQTAARVLLMGSASTPCMPRSTCTTRSFLFRHDSVIHHIRSIAYRIPVKRPCREPNHLRGPIERSHWRTYQGLHWRRHSRPFWISCRQFPFVGSTATTANFVSAPIVPIPASTPVKLLGHCARNCRLRASAKKPPVDRRRLVTDPQFRQEVATAIGRHLRANPPGDSSVDDVEAAFVAAIMRTAELVIPPQERRIPARGWSGDARTEAELQAATDAMHTARQRLRMDTRDAQLRRAVRKACNWLKRVRSAAVVRFFERHVVELEKQLRMGDQHGFFQNIKSVQLEETKKVESQCIRDEEGRLLRDKGRIRERWVR